MNTSSSLNLKESCHLYAVSMQKTLRNLLNVEVTPDADVQTTSDLEVREIFFSILFTGQVYGEFIVGINRSTALGLLGIPKNQYQENRDLVLDTFRELLNIAAGTTLTHLKTVIPDISITPPRAVEGQLILSTLQIERQKLQHGSGDVSCYVYVDKMRLDVADALELGRRQLVQEHLKQEELQRLNRAKSEFLANMSHELRTPLNGMIGMLDMVKNTNLTDAQRSQIDVICTSGDFLLSIINDILEFSKIESGKLEIESRPFDPRQCIESVCESMASQVYSKGLEFNVTIDPRLHDNYLGDETRLKQVIVNLIGNAIKFTPTGSISVVAGPSDEDHFHISITDTGIGIPADRLSSIFDSFSQVDVSDTRRYGGSGLGLTISKSIIDAMKGALRVSSREAQGSTFTIELGLPALCPMIRIERPKLPLVRFMNWVESPSLVQVLNAYLEKPDLKSANDEPAEVEIVEFRCWAFGDTMKKSAYLDLWKKEGTYILFLIRPDEFEHLESIDPGGEFKNYFLLNLPLSITKLMKSLTTRPRAHSEQKAVVDPVLNRDERLRILLVEDNEINQKIASLMLTTLGHEVEIAKNGQEALEKMERPKFDLILMDCQMPVLDGYQATLKIRERERASNASFTPIVAMTANAFRETKERCFECGMNDFVTKPIKSKGLDDVIRRTLESCKRR